MKWYVVERNWKHLKGKLRGHWTGRKDGQAAALANPSGSWFGAPPEAYDITHGDCAPTISPVPKVTLAEGSGGPCRPFMRRPI